MGTTYDDWKTTPPGDDEPDVEACGHRVGTCEGECRLEEDDYCYTCGGAHPTSTHDTGRVIRLAADTEPAPALEEESEMAEGTRTQWRNREGLARWLVVRDWDGPDVCHFEARAQDIAACLRANPSLRAEVMTELEDP